MATTLYLTDGLKTTTQLADYWGITVEELIAYNSSGNPVSEDDEGGPYEISYRNSFDVSGITSRKFKLTNANMIDTYTYNADDNYYEMTSEFPPEIIQLRWNGAVIERDHYTYSSSSGTIVISNSIPLRSTNTATIKYTQWYKTTNLGNYLSQLSILQLHIPKGIMINVSDPNTPDATEFYTLNDSTSITGDNGSYYFEGQGRDDAPSHRWSCYCYIYKGTGVDEIKLPVYPESVEDTSTAEFQPQTMLGRSVSYQIYNSSSRTVSFDLVLHRELVDDLRGYDIDTLIAKLHSVCYPAYDNDVVTPCQVAFSIGSQFYVKGILSNVSAQWDGPIVWNNNDGKWTQDYDNGYYNSCKLSISVTETKGPYSQAEIVEMKGDRRL